MKRLKALPVLAAVLVTMTGCGAQEEQKTDVTPGYSENAEQTETESSSSEIISSEREYTDSDIQVIDFFLNYLTDSEEFTDLKNYRYYARTLGLDKDRFLAPEMWEVFYNEQININKDVDEREYYLIRINPYKLLDVYADNLNTDPITLCESLSVTPAQLYYNWGFNPNSFEYAAAHEKNTVTYSKKEQDIFGAYNEENRCAVMSTHMITVDNLEGTVAYSSELPDSLAIKRRDILKAFTEITPLYSGYTDEEKAPSYILNGIGVRTVIPLTVPNACREAEGADKEISVMVNMSPFSYGCTDSDIIDMMPYIAEHSQSDN